MVTLPNSLSRRGVVDFPTTDYQEQSWDDFSGGLNNRVAPTRIDRNQSQSCENFHSDLVKALVRRKGFTQWGAVLASPVVSAWEFYRLESNGTYTRYVMVSYGTVVRARTPAGAWADVVTGLTSGLRFGAATMNNQVWFGNAVDSLRSWDGTNVTVYAGAPKGNQIRVHHSRLTIAGDPANPSRVYVSNLGDPTTYDAVAGFFDFDEGDGDRVTGIIPLPDGALMAFKEYSRHVLRGTGPGSWNRIPFRDGVGCVGHWAACYVKDTGEVAYLSRRGVYLTNGQSNKPVSDRIYGQSPSTVDSVQAWNQAYLHLATMAYHRMFLHLSVPSTTLSTVNDRSYWLQFIQGDNEQIRPEGWWPQTIACGAQVNLFDGTEDVLLGTSPTTGMVHKLWDGDNDGGAAYASTWKGRDDDLGAPLRLKRSKEGFGTQQAQLGTWTTQISWVFDFGQYVSNMFLTVSGGDLAVFDLAEFDIATFTVASIISSMQPPSQQYFAYVRPEVRAIGSDQPATVYLIGLSTHLTERRVGYL